MASRLGTTASSARGRQPNRLDLVFAGVSLALGLVYPLWQGAGLAETAGVALAGVVGGAAVGFLPPRVRLPGYVGGLLLGALVLSLLALGDRWYLTWLFTYFVGVLLSFTLRSRLDRNARGAAPEQAADPDAVVVRWAVGDRSEEVVDPGPDRVLDAVRALDGDQRTAVSLLRGRRRLDVFGDARRAVLVLQSDDHADHRTAWHHVTSEDATAAGHGEEDVDVTVAGWPGHFRRSQVTTIDAALSAAEHFLASGGRAPGLTWHSDPHVVDLRGPWAAER
jgi:hypothetical protein